MSLPVARGDCVAPTRPPRPPMFRNAHRPINRLAFLVLLVPSISGCMTTRHAAFNNGAQLDQITGVSLRSGQEIRFQSPGASITNDTMYALGPKGQLLLPTDSIAQVSNRKVSPL